MHLRFVGHLQVNICEHEQDVQLWTMQEFRAGQAREGMEINGISYAGTVPRVPKAAKINSKAKVQGLPFHLHSSSSQSIPS